MLMSKYEKMILLIEEIFDNDNQIALIIRNNFKSEKIQ